ncbi:hypothetical protein KUTeg_012450 [Tegillarca granosa]|uniref:Neurotransmitter-gated ion-channel ligand-binding domain-containing protein n=1 Tax=Tegillarca granosa TaxID=220873 RepID=A0ABQ9F340_TEGGR|nr:hypothetical protein KUTeg_012450 [Tegillarca granosa]
MGTDHFQAETDLHNNVLEHYSRTSRPTTNPSNPIDIALTPSDFQIEDVDDYGNTMTSAFMMSMSWYDKRLQWNKTEYGDIDQTRILVDELWTPDISVYNLLHLVALEYAV